jgi:ribosomal protein L16 Arg81 hydroxylase
MHFWAVLFAVVFFCVRGAGRKRWHVLAPRNAFYTKTHINEWLESAHYAQLRGEGKVLQCIQEPGDIL